LPSAPSEPIGRTAMSLPARSTAMSISSRSSHTARWRSRVTGLPVIWPEIRRRRSPTTKSIAQATAAMTSARSPSGAVGWKPSGYSSAMKLVDRRPSSQRGCCIRAERKGML